MMKRLNTPLTDYQYDCLERIAHGEHRQLNDFIYMLIDRGLSFYFCDTHASFKKLKSEFTEEELKQLEINKTCKNPDDSKYKWVDQWWGDVKVMDIGTSIEDLAVNKTPLGAE